MTAVQTTTKAMLTRLNHAVDERLFRPSSGHIRLVRMVSVSYRYTYRSTKGHDTAQSGVPTESEI